MTYFMPYRMRFAPLAVSFIIIVAGCGGSSPSLSPLPGGNLTPTPVVVVTPTPAPTNEGRQNEAVRVTPRFTIEWAARSLPGVSRAVPSSALSVVVVLTSGTESVRALVNRDVNRTEAHTAEYTAPEVRPGLYTVSVIGFAEPDEQGTVVGRGIFEAAIDAATTNLGSISTAGNVFETFVTANDPLIVGETRLLNYGAENEFGNALMVTPGSVFFTLVSGDAIRLLPDQRFEAVKPGVAFVRVTIDGVASEPQAILVVSNAAVSVTPEFVTLPVRDRRRFTATVTDAPEGGVVWSVSSEGDAGTIDANGVYTAPNVTGSYEITATSIYDPTKSGTATVNVVAEGTNVPVDNSLSGELPIIVN